MKPESHPVFRGASRLEVHEYRGYEIFVVAVPGHREDLPGHYPRVSFRREGEQREEFLTATLTYTPQRRCESFEEAIALGLKLGKEAIDERVDEAAE